MRAGSVISAEDDLRFAQMAIEEARESIPENDGQVHPRVGTVVVKGGEVLAKAHRGESPESHAEFIALAKLSDAHVAGATVYTTLEPCTTRRGLIPPCAFVMVQRRVSRVVIGIVDPNPAVCGNGCRVLMEADIATHFFSIKLAAQVTEMNREFIQLYK